jgi:hypothetical protein
MYFDNIDKISFGHLATETFGHKRVGYLYVANASIGFAVSKQRLNRVATSSS